MPEILVDTGVWISFFDPREREKRGDAEVEALYDLLSPHQIVMPWPVVYETLRTRFVRNTIAVVEFEKLLKSRAIIFLDDKDYREAALEQSLASSREQMKLSMVDCLIRLVLSDPANKIDYLATFNTRDFADVCLRRRITVFPD